MKLTIGIPAYNLERTISKTLDSIIDQIKTSYDIEILISDNCSTDDTAKLVKQYQKKHPKLISYYKQTENIGYSGNLAAVFDKAKGTYVWLCGDDAFMDGGLESFYKLIKDIESSKKQLPATILTKAVSTNDIVVDSPQITYQEEVSGNNFYYKDIYELRSKERVSIVIACFLSVTIIKKDEWDRVLENIDLEGDYPHTEAVWRISQDKPIAVIDKFLIYAQEASWSDAKSPEFQVIAPMSYLVLLKKIFGNYDLLTKRDRKNAMNHIFGAINHFRKKVKKTSSINKNIAEIDFFPRPLFFFSKYVSLVNNLLAFKLIVAYIKIDKSLRKADPLSLYNAIILTIILLLLLF